MPKKEKCPKCGFKTVITWTGLNNNEIKSCTNVQCDYVHEES